MKKNNKMDGYTVAIILILLILILFVFGFQYIEKWVYDVWPYEVGNVAKYSLPKLTAQFLEIAIVSCYRCWTWNLLLYKTRRNFWSGNRKKCYDNANNTYNGSFDVRSYCIWYRNKSRNFCIIASITTAYSICNNGRVT